MTSAEPLIRERCGMTSAEPPIQGRCGDDQRRAADTRAGRRWPAQSRRYKGGVLDWAHTCHYNSVAFVMAHAWYAPTYFSTFFSIAAEFILRVYVQQLHFVLNSPIQGHGENYQHKP
jgi:hypothetical protein